MEKEQDEGERDVDEESGHWLGFEVNGDSPLLYAPFRQNRTLRPA